MKPFQHKDEGGYTWYDPFNEFDPLAILTPPENTPVQLAYVSRRAQHILNTRSINELHAGLDTLIWMLSRAGSDVASFQRRESESDFPERFSYSDCPIKNHVDELGQPLRGYYDDTDFDRLCRCIGDYDLSGQPDFPDATTTDYFAILSLVFISEVLRLANFMNKYGGNDFLVSLYPSKIDEYFFGAIQSISHAENLITLENAEKEALSKRATSAAKSRLPNFSKLKEFCQKTFDNLYPNSDINSLAAARHIYSILSPKQINTFITPDEKERIERIARWLRRHRAKHQ